MVDGLGGQALVTIQHTYGANSPAGKGGGDCVWDCGDGGGSVEITDLLALLAQWDGPGSCDFDASGAVDIVDLLKLLANWGPCP